MHFFQNTLGQYTIPQDGAISATLTCYYLIVTIQSVIKILSTPISNAVCYYRC